MRASENLLGSQDFNFDETEAGNFQENGGANAFDSNIPVFSKFESLNAHHKQNLDS